MLSGALAAVSRNAHSGWWPKPRLNVGAAQSFSECAVIRWRTRRPPPKGVRLVVGGVLAGQRLGGRQRRRPCRGDRGQAGRGVGGEDSASARRGRCADRPQRHRPGEASSKYHLLATPADCR